VSAARYPFAEALPAPGESISVAPGVSWIRMPLPFALDHINLWVIEDGEGWALIDTGYGVPATWELWEKHFAGTLGGRPVTKVIVTHYHPDHLGSAAWLVERTGAPFWMTTGEFLAGHAARNDTAGFDRDTGIDFLKRHGLPEALIPERMRAGGNGYAKGVPDIPKRYRRLMHGDRLTIGGDDWEVITVFGHAPEHAALWCEARGLLISGDQVLPKITTNVSVWGSQPDADPLTLFLDSLGRFSHLPGDTRVLPSHDRVFHGLHERIAELHAHHAERLDRLHAALDTPKSAADVLPILFRRTLDGHQMMFAMGEAVAHLHRLMYGGRVRREEIDGVFKFVAA
jgi:glyoxylase-like metal-dependent hydrolase (beta-lactamase superfamily II)